MKKIMSIFVISFVVLGADAQVPGLSFPDASKKMDILGYCSQIIAGKDTAIPVGAKVLYYSSELKRFYVQGFDSFGLSYPGSDRVEVKAEFKDVNEPFESKKRLFLTVSFDFSIAGEGLSQTRKITFFVEKPETNEAKISLKSLIRISPRPDEVQELSGAHCRAFGSSNISEDFIETK